LKSSSEGKKKGNELDRKLNEEKEKVKKIEEN